MMGGGGRSPSRLEPKAGVVFKKKKKPCEVQLGGDNPGLVPPNNARQRSGDDLGKLTSKTAW